MPKNLIEHWKSLSETDKECILRTVRRTPRYEHVTPGMLPMLHLAAVIEALDEHIKYLKNRIDKSSGGQTNWMNAYLVMATAARAKLPEQLEDEPEVLWVSTKAKDDGTGSTP